MKLIILDRDGVINRDSDAYIKHPDEWAPIAGSLEAIARLNHAGYRVVIATNQSGLGRGLFNVDQLNAIHQKMFDALSQQGGHIDALFFCPHRPDENCGCRKPKPGLLLEIASRLNADLSEAFFIGDSLKDIQAAQTTGAQPILVLTGNGKTTASQIDDSDNIPVYADLAAAVDALLTNTK
ncbi:MAG: D-glycero-beta-D-manno-heptose 1,7-bisphosphate 7-phosphatase [Candidatus Polarisedimenticolaceae bacterium]|nr:D-glycero-beta-D-manno-heptose 1,7-bisphosphate 7-phosphatase [Candidatus Polarisedimenticolaceae bacterium]